MSDDLAPRDPKTPVRRGGSVTSLTSEPMTDQKVGMSSSDKWPTLPSVVTAPLIGGMQADYEVLCGETCVKVKTRSVWLKAALCGHAFDQCAVCGEIRDAVHALKFGKRNRSGICNDKHGNPLGDIVTVEVCGTSVRVGTHVSPIRLLADEATIHWFISALRDDISNNANVSVVDCAVDSVTRIVDGMMTPSTVAELKLSGVCFQMSRISFNVLQTAAPTKHKLPREFRCRKRMLAANVETELNLQRDRALRFQECGADDASDNG